MLKIMTPGPTQVRENVRIARAMPATNPDLDPAFYQDYKETCGMIGEILKTRNEVFILSGEGILGLEAACASLTEPGDRVLVIDNGVYGAGFADFVKLYGGEPVLYTKSYRETINVQELEQYLAADHGFKYATVVHNDTPSGMTNDVEAIGQVLDRYGILSVVDSVSAMVGEELDVDRGRLDIVCGASQKAVSAQPGLTFVTVSNRALEAMENRETPIASYYANLLIFKGWYEKQWFPYTMPASDIYGLRAALSNILADTGITERHRTVSEAVRRAITDAGLSLYGRSGYSNLVTVFEVPDQIDVNDILDYMRKEELILLAGSFGEVAGRIIRIGHMGENANYKDVLSTLAGLDRAFLKYGYRPAVPMAETFSRAMEQK